MGRTDVCGAGNGLLKPPVKMAFVDRLKPKCSYANNTEAWNKVQHSKPGAIAKMSKNNSRSPTQHRAKAIIKKYKRQVRMTEFKRLKSIVPAIAENDEATEEVILEECQRGPRGGRPLQHEPGRDEGAAAEVHPTPAGGQAEDQAAPGINQVEEIHRAKSDPGPGQEKMTVGKKKNLTCD